MVAIGPDEPAKATELAEDLGLGFPVASDEGLVLTRKFGIVFQAPERDPLPVPAVYLVAPDGTIEFHYVHPDYKIRLDPEVLLAAARVGGRAEQP